MRLELIHPMIVHFPIVLTLGLFVIDAVAWTRGSRFETGSAIGNTSAGLAAVAGVFALVAYVFGDQALDIAAAQPSAPMQALEIHETLGSVSAFAIAAWAVLRGVGWWRMRRLERGMGLGVVAVEAGLCLAVLVTAWYGGQLVYDHGVAVMQAGA